jgi:hypothetical protein
MKFICSSNTHNLVQLFGFHCVGGCQVYLEGTKDERGLYAGDQKPPTAVLQGNTPRYKTVRQFYRIFITTYVVKYFCSSNIALNCGGF